jgi:tripartite-type tricarboxylate transporter receptor subunit TctC
MKRPHRRQFLHLTVGAVALPVVSSKAWAQSYPTRPVRWIVTAAAGGAADILARLLGSWLSERLRQQFVVENRTGAAGNIGTESVVRSPADGYTIHLTATSDAINATLYDKLNFSLLRDMAPVACLIRSPFVLVVRPSFPAKTVPELIAHAKAHLGTINFASGGTGFTTHIAGEMFKMMTGVNMVHVPLPWPGSRDDGSPGRSGSGHVRPGCHVARVHPGRTAASLAVTTPVRSDVLPDVPTVGDFVPGYEASIWFGVGAPSGTPADIVY